MQDAHCIDVHLGDLVVDLYFEEAPELEEGVSLQRAAFSNHKLGKDEKNIPLECIHDDLIASWQDECRSYLKRLEREAEAGAEADAYFRELDSRGF